MADRVPLACGIHEARRLIPCPICPRVLAELRDEPVPLRRFVVGTASATDAPSKKRPSSPAPSTRVGVGVGRTKRLNDVERRDIARRARRGETTQSIARALGVNARTVTLWRNR